MISIFQEETRAQTFVIGNDETELELSVESRSFVNRVNDQVRKKTEKNFQNNRNSIVNTSDLTLKQMFDISAKLVSEQEEITGLETIGWENHSWKYMSLIGHERIINLQRTKVYVFSDSELCLGRIHQNLESDKAWEEK